MTRGKIIVTGRSVSGSNAAAKAWKTKKSERRHHGLAVSAGKINDKKIR